MKQYNDYDEYNRLHLNILKLRQIINYKLKNNCFSLVFSLQFVFFFVYMYLYLSVDFSNFRTAHHNSSLVLITFYNNLYFYLFINFGTLLYINIFRVNLQRTSGSQFTIQTYQFFIIIWRGWVK